MGVGCSHKIIGIGVASLGAPRNSVAGLAESNLRKYCISPVTQVGQEMHQRAHRLAPNATVLKHQALKIVIRSEYCENSR